MNANGIRIRTWTLFVVCGLAVSCGKAHESATEAQIDSKQSPVTVLSESTVPSPKAVPEVSAAESKPSASGAPVESPTPVAPSANAVPEVSNTEKPTEVDDGSTPPEATELTELEAAQAELEETDQLVSQLLNQLFKRQIKDYPSIRMSFLQLVNSQAASQDALLMYLKVYTADREETKSSLEALQTKVTLTDTESDLESQLKVLLSTQTLKIETTQAQIDANQPLVDALIFIAEYMEIRRPALLELIEKLKSAAEEKTANS